MSEKKKSVRTSQLITPFGPGAVVELGGESFTCNDIRSWPADACTPIAENSLARILGKKIRQPPIKDHTRGSVPFSRFPRWLFCPTCRKLYHYKLAADRAAEFKTPICNSKKCKGVSLVPMRFVAACEAGHLQDVDWYWWAHRNSQAAETGQCVRTTGELYFVTSGASGGDFDSMRITCSCGASNSFEGLTDRAFMNCLGRQPWEHSSSTGPCNLPVEVHPRAASSIYYSDTRSALDLATGDVADEMNKERGLRDWLDKSQLAMALREAAGTAKATWRTNFATILSMVVDEACRQFGVSQSAAEITIATWVDGTQKTEGAETNEFDHSQHGILKSEWPFIATNQTIRTRNLQAKPYATKEHWPEQFSALIDQVTLVERLREVRALLGFRRLKGDNHVPVDIVNETDWLPGVEAFGEGIFIRFNMPALRKWERSVAGMFAARAAYLTAKNEQWGKRPADVYSSPRFIALHTFAHSLIRRLAFDAGYSSSSLRERIYADDGELQMAGLLIYTSDSDSEGSLGGLVRQGTPDRLLSTIKRSIADLSWCSADPVCSEMDLQGVDGMNSAACHACSLIAETSCMYNNSLLDRRLLIGDGKGTPALFGDLMPEVN